MTGKQAPGCGRDVGKSFVAAKKIGTGEPSAAQEELVHDSTAPRLSER
jgi:hypothetical protein